MKTKIINWVFIVIFMIALLAPLTLIDVNGGRISEQENRVLAARPPISDLFNQPENFITRFDKWFSDSIGFREGLISLHKKIEALDEPVQYTDGQYVYLIGEQGHRFFAYTDGWMIGKYQGKALLTDDQLSGMGNGLIKAKQYLDEKGIPITMVISPDKDSVYPEYYPKSIVRGPEPIQLDIITDYLKDNSGVDVYNIKASLVSQKERYSSFNKAAGDLTHYNEIGAFLEYEELMEHINEHSFEIEPFTIEDVDIAYSESGVPDVTLRQSITYEELAPSFFDDVELHRPFTWENRAFETPNADLPTILFMRDSSARLFADFVVPHFSKTIMIHWSNMEHFEEYVDLYNPDIVVFECAEREIRGFADSIIRYSNTQQNTSGKS